ncbi:hypothetical protein [Eubacterium oxidoreducens]|uniref:Flagellar operon protein TIGR03826 n=1 Tax=Eubacterium oxidoreducens TaxID=1732 RepID=A0A1G6BCB6_EUBOX|nr:hypothetical protein [Eubacterium oxidoreducens]SDB18271.1 hypothetical protein SAMN02910417_01354 [Eubacterium oxidoreducens]
MSDEKKIEFVDARTPIKQCEECGRAMPIDYPHNICPTCKENSLFREVREFIRANDVNEYQVADKFNLPVEQVKNWIRNGRIEYKQLGEKNLMGGNYCARCGASVSFGTLCPKCLRLMNNQKKGVAIQKPSDSDNSKMRFLDN